MPAIPYPNLLDCSGLRAQKQRSHNQILQVSSWAQSSTRTLTSNDAPATIPMEIGKD